MAHFNTRSLVRTQCNTFNKQSLMRKFRILLLQQLVKHDIRSAVGVHAPQQRASRRFILGRGKLLAGQAGKRPKRQINLTAAPRQLAFLPALKGVGMLAHSPKRCARLQGDVRLSERLTAYWRAAAPGWRAQAQPGLSSCSRKYHLPPPAPSLVQQRRAVILGTFSILGVFWPGCAKSWAGSAHLANLPTGVFFRPRGICVPACRRELQTSV